MVLLVWCWFGTKMNLGDLVKSGPQITEFLSLLFPPDMGWNSEEFLFSVGLKERAQLDIAVISQNLRDLFEYAGEALSDKSDVSVEENGTKWLITDEHRTYIVLNDGNTLNTYLEDARPFPPPLRLAGAVVVVTLQISFLGTIFGTAVALVLGLLAAENLTPHWLHHSIKIILALLRSIPVLLLALLFVAAVGLGSFPGVMAIAIHSIGMLGKLFSEECEMADQGALEAMESAGANWLQKVRYAVWPQVSAQIYSLTLFRFEMNIRDSAVLGLVGVAGLGLWIENYRRALEYQSLATMVIVTMLVVLVVDQTSFHIRRQLR